MSFAQAINGQCSMTYKTEFEHPPASPEVLRTSSHIRSGLHEAALNLGMTESRLKNCEDDTLSILTTELNETGRVLQTPFKQPIRLVVASSPPTSSTWCAGLSDGY